MLDVDVCAALKNAILPACALFFFTIAFLRSRMKGCH